MSAVRNVLAGALSGLGVVVLLQQFAIAYPTGLLTIVGVLCGVAVQLGIAWLVRPRAAHATVQPVTPQPVTAQPVTPQYAGTVDRAAAVEPIDTEPPSTAVDGPSWEPTHVVPATGLDARTEPDPGASPVARLDPALGVRVVARAGDWAQVVCENEWTAWVDARQLEELR